MKWRRKKSFIRFDPDQLRLRAGVNVIKLFRHGFYFFSKYAGVNFLPNQTFVGEAGEPPEWSNLLSPAPNPNCKSDWCHHTRQNDTQHNDTRHNETWSTENRTLNSANRCYERLFCRVSWCQLMLPCMSKIATWD